MFQSTIPKMIEQNQVLSTLVLTPEKKYILPEMCTALQNMPCLNVKLAMRIDLNPYGIG
jgi:hypothetical protein